MQLTESDTEYSVFVVKHIYPAHVVFQFNCTNTIAEQVLEQVSVAMDLAEAVSDESLNGSQPYGHVNGLWACICLRI